MSDIVTMLPWEEKDWFQEMSAWLKYTLGTRNVEMSGVPALTHSAPWSIVYSVPTDNGLFYFKALCQRLKHEPLLTKQLSRWQPDLIQSVIEIDSTRGWMLMPDGGTTLRQVLAKTPSINYWKKILPQYARFQKAMLPYKNELLGLGMVERGLKTLPVLSKNLMTDRKAMCVDQPDGFSLSDFESLLNVMPKLQKMCEQLSEYKIPETIQHDDFHDGNIFVNANGFRFFDWAEAFIAHPFFTLVVTLRSIAYRFELDENSPELQELLNLYLMEWQEFGSLKSLREACELAMTIGRINRALTWHMVVSSLPELHRSKQADAVPGWVQLFLERIKLYV